MNSSAAQPDADDAAIRRTVELLRAAEAARASDVHLQLDRSGAATVSFRIDGLLVNREPLAAGLAERVFGRIKFLARLKTYQESLPQDGRMAKDDLGIAHDVRVATYPTVIGERIVLRLFSPGGALELDELGLEPTAVEALSLFLRQPGGLLLLTGPAGSGKTTTIYACLRDLAKQGGRHIVTVEDPVEQILPGVTQTEVNEARGLTYAAAARHLLRQDPQVLVIGEIRDEDTARIAVRAGLTGHLVIATLHAGSCRGVVDRLLTLCPDPSAVAAAIGMIFNQRLLRRTCAGCGGKGCEECADTGAKGRVPVAEWWKAGAVPDLASVRPNRTLREAANELVRIGRVGEAEVLRALGADVGTS
jgi:type II secretory ATPase GspE/PulE/Tfp pilus assembly ATPase PilB-like protein